MMFSATFERGAREAAEKYLDPEHFKISVRFPAILSSLL